MESLIVMRLLAILLSLAMPHVVLAESKQRTEPLACDGTVALFYGDELIWHKNSNEIQHIEGLVQLPGLKGFGALPLRSLLSVRPDIVAIEIESCRPRQKRFDRAELESKAGDDLYLVATNYRGFKLATTSEKGGGGRGMKNIGRIVLLTASQADGSTRLRGSRRGDSPDKVDRSGK